MNDRRFTEEEAAEILKQAVELQHSETSVSAPVDGLTLSELQEIGREVGVAPEVIQQVARRIERDPKPARTFFGLPAGVSRTIELERNLTEAEWDRLVVILRETFDAKGVVKNEGSLRSWRNGNLHVMLEPTSSGHRLRLRTLNGNALGWMTGGLAVIGLALIVLIAGFVKGTISYPGIPTSLVILAGMGIGMFGIGALPLFSWARRRAGQMDEIADRVISRISNE